MPSGALLEDLTVAPYTHIQEKSQNGSAQLCIEFLMTKKPAGAFFTPKRTTRVNHSIEISTTTTTTVGLFKNMFKLTAYCNKCQMRQHRHWWSKLSHMLQPLL